MRVSKGDKTDRRQLFSHILQILCYFSVSDANNITGGQETLNMKPRRQSEDLLSPLCSSCLCGERAESEGLSAQQARPLSINPGLPQRYIEHREICANLCNLWLQGDWR